MTFPGLKILMSNYETLWTGHNCLNYHLYSKLSISHTEQCPCGTGSQTTTSTAVLPHLQATQKENLARPHRQQSIYCSPAPSTSHSERESGQTTQTTEHLLQSCPIYKPLRKGIWPDHTDNRASTAVLPHLQATQKGNLARPHRQQSIYCSPAPSTSHSERESGQTTQTTEHLLQSCPIYEPLRKGIWPDHTDNRASTAVLPHLRATQKGNLARPHRQQSIYCSPAPSTSHSERESGQTTQTTEHLLQSCPIYKPLRKGMWPDHTDNRASTAVLPHLQATQKGNVARPHRQQSIYCSPAPSTSHSERESGQTTQTTEHLLQSCPIYEPLRKGMWPDHTENRASTAVLPHLRATQKGNLARPHRQQSIYCSPAPSTSHSERECGQTTQTTEHLLQSCPIYEPLRKGIWPDHTDNRASTAVLPHLRATQKGNLARPHRQQSIYCSPAPSTSHSERESGQTTQTTEHLLQSCPIYEPLRKGIWPDHTDNRASTAVLPHLRATQKGNVARPHRQQSIYCSPAPPTSHSERECGQTTQTTEHLLQSCPIYKPLRKGMWPDHTDNRASTAVLPHLQATQKGNLARPHRQQSIYCSPAPSTSHSERESGQTTQTTEHLLQSCPIYKPLRKGMWPDHTDNRASTAVLPHLQATQKGNVARPHRQQSIYCSPAPSTSHSERECGQTTQTTEHLLLSCPIYKPLRKGMWPDHTDNRASTAVLPHLRATQKRNLARPHSRSSQAVQGPVMYCHLH